LVSTLCRPILPLRTNTSSISTNIKQGCHFGHFLGKLRPKDVRRTCPAVRTSTTAVAGKRPLHPAVGLVLQWFYNGFVSSGWPGGRSGGQLADHHPNRWMEQLSASRALDIVTDQRSAWPSAKPSTMPSARADRRVEWRTAYRPTDVCRGLGHLMRPRLRPMDV
jgi:hypothetical protein